MTLAHFSLRMLFFFILPLSLPSLPFSFLSHFPSFPPSLHPSAPFSHTLLSFFLFNHQGFVIIALINSSLSMRPVLNFIYSFICQIEVQILI